LGINNSLIGKYSTVEVSTVQTKFTI